MNLRAIARKVGQWLRSDYRWYVDKVSRRGVAVDPGRFPDAEYPVHCLRCGYSLLGLADGCCPECGELFTRGRLLVRIYAHLHCHARLRNQFLGVIAAMAVFDIAWRTLLWWQKDRLFELVALWPITVAVFIAGLPMISAMCFGIMLIFISARGVRLPARNKRVAVRRAAQRALRGQSAG